MSKPSKSRPDPAPHRRVMRFFETYPWIVIVLAPLLIIYTRAPDAFHSPNFWAEDGVIFFRQWQALGLSSLFETYNPAFPE